MHPTVQHVVAALALRGVAGEIVELPAAVPTAAAAAAQLGCTAGEIANSLIFSVDDVPLLVVSSGSHRVSTRRLAGLAGVARRRVRSPGHEFVERVTGQEVGGIAPVGHPQPIRTFVDIRLRQHPRLWAGAGLRHTVFAISFAALLQVTRGEAAAVGEDLAQLTACHFAVN